MSWLSESVNDYIQEITPVDDIKKHFMLDECWCIPRIEYVPNILCEDGFVRAGMIFIHNSADNREEREKVNV